MSQGRQSEKSESESVPQTKNLESAPPRDSSILSNKVDTFSEISRDKDSGHSFWKRMDAHNQQVLGSFKRTYKINSSINIILVIIGVVLIGNAIVYSWLYGTKDGWSIFSGGIGLGALVALFFYKSQDAVSKAAANLAIVDMAFNSNYRAYESITDYDYKADNQLPHRQIDDLKTMLDLLEKTTKAHVDMIAAIQLIEGVKTKDSGTPPR